MCVSSYTRIVSKTYLVIVNFTEFKIDKIENEIENMKKVSL